MKILLSLIVGILCYTQISAQEYYYYYKGEKIHLELNPEYVFVSGTDIIDIENIQLSDMITNASDSLEVVEDIASQTLAKPIGFVEQHPVRYWAEIRLSDNLSQTNYLEQLAQLRTDNANLIVAPYFQSESTDKIGLSNYFYVKLRHQDDFNVLLEQIEIHNVELVGYNKFMPLWFTLSVKSNTLNIMEMANVFYETGLFQYAEPDLMVDRLLNEAQSPSNTPFVPNDPFYPDQWHLNNTGQNGGIAGIDINAEDAWNTALGNSVTVAVVDQGFEMDHPDLINNTIGTGYDTNTASSPSVVRGPHGTACAGIVGAESNNNEGVSGVAPNVGLVSVSQSFAGTNVAQELADGINWASQNGADVISNSWGGGTSNNFIEDAIDNALANGRDGLGAIIVFATGNDNNNAISFPANYDPDILAVGAMSPCGERKNPASCDNENWWGSNFGNRLDIVAPGVLIPTTDIQGDIPESTCFTPRDYNPSPCFNNIYPNQNYFSRFNGTSSACPQVAGVAALVLSVNPNFTVQEVNDIIEQSAQKVRGDLYNYQNWINRPNGTWNNEMGYGLVDAHQAVLLAQEQTCQIDITLSGTISDSYEVSETINAMGNIEENETITFSAGRSIFLNEVFIADSDKGSTFLAHIEGCDSNGLINDTPIAEDSIVYMMEEIDERLVTTDTPVTFRNLPNPFTQQTTIEFTLSKDAPVTLLVFDSMGRKVASLLKAEPTTTGTHQVTFKGTDYPSGVYYYTIQAGAFFGTQKMTLIR